MIEVKNRGVMFRDTEDVELGGRIRFTRRENKCLSFFPCLCFLMRYGLGDGIVHNKLEMSRSGSQVLLRHKCLSIVEYCFLF